VDPVIARSVVIAAPPERVWRALTEPALMKQWMGDPGMDVGIVADWVVGGAVVVSGFHHVRFENRGTVLAVEPGALLRYTQLSSISRLPDTPQNHSTLEFRLAPIAGGTQLALTISGFPTETIFKHLDFYWRVTLGILQKLVEASSDGSSTTTLAVPGS
jgi:uncharacterized protein YndB with AHSA1/START domain